MANASRARRIHGVSARDLFDKLALMVAAVGGVTGGIVLKTLDFPPVMPALFSAGVLLVYVFATWLVGRLRLEPEAIGDNCYYLGFIFTLASLAYTLHGIAGSPENTKLVTDIVSGFGIALSSTIVGVILRLFLLQFRPDMVAKDRETRIALSDATRDFRTALGQSTTDLKQFAVEIEQKLTEHHAVLIIESTKSLAAHRAAIEAEARRSTEALHKATADAVTKALGAVEDMTKRIAEQSETTTRESAERTRATLEGFAHDLTEALAQLTDRMAELAEEGVAAGQTLQDGLRDVRSSTDRFRKAMERLSADVESAAPAIEGSAKRAASAMEAASLTYAGQLETVATRLSSNHAAETMEVASATFATRIDAAASKLSSNRGVETMEAAATAFATRIDAAASKLSSNRAAETLEAASTAFATRMEAVASRLSANRFEEVFEGHDARLADIAKLIKDSARLAEESLTMTREVGGRSEKALEAFERAVAKLGALRPPLQPATVAAPQANAEPVAEPAPVVTPLRSVAPPSPAVVPSGSPAPAPDAEKPVANPALKDERSSPDTAVDTLATPSEDDSTRVEQAPANPPVEQPKPAPKSGFFGWGRR